jgi:hypothetical protein
VRIGVEGATNPQVARFKDAQHASRNGLLRRSLEEYVEPQTRTRGEAVVERRFLLPGFELLEQARVAGRHLDDPFVGLDREIEIPLRVRELPEQMRRVGELGFHLQRALQEADRLVVAAQQMRRSTCAGERRGVPRVARQRLPERRCRPFGVPPLNGFPARAQRALGRRLRARPRERPHEYHLQHERERSSKCSAVGCNAPLVGAVLPDRAEGLPFRPSSDGSVCGTRGRHSSSSVCLPADQRSPASGCDVRSSADTLPRIASKNASASA